MSSSDGQSGVLKNAYSALTPDGFAFVVPVEAAVSVPAGFKWRLTSIRADMKTCAKAGNRVWACKFYDSVASRIYNQLEWLPTQAASLTRHLQADPGSDRSAAFVNPDTAFAPLNHRIALVSPADGSMVSYIEFLDRAAIAPNSFNGLNPDSIDATHLDDTTHAPAWGVNAWAGYVVRVGNSRGTVQSNTASVLTIDAWDNGTPGIAHYTIGGDQIKLYLAADEIPI